MGEWTGKRCGERKGGWKEGIRDVEAEKGARESNGEWKGKRNEWHEAEGGKWG